MHNDASAVPRSATNSLLAASRALQAITGSTRDSHSQLPFFSLSLPTTSSRQPLSPPASLERKMRLRRSARLQRCEDGQAKGKRSRRDFETPMSRDAAPADGIPWGISPDAYQRALAPPAEDDQIMEDDVEKMASLESEQSQDQEQDEPATPPQRQAPQHSPLMELVLNNIRTSASRLPRYRDGKPQDRKWRQDTIISTGCVRVTKNRADMKSVKVKTVT
ncbi:uncharacterized protein J7T54_008285 [Emericellopsis cladophorae]|uniref:Uncharacterized protein n=1 Tax=Emericellopsis cladophorae TaxID=2686198 RepID=A0A9P9XWE4_9HYPO|nr:uncharacterized protein J7T54_008285 [Emericellopsis cladophorae]KAI6779067.1 hypothetical protein J7T54_008285 [Emericellopsis cladophorae]